MADESIPCALCTRTAESILGEDHCLGCERDALLEACKEARDLLRHHHEGKEGKVYMVLRAVITKAERSEHG